MAAYNYYGNPYGGYYYQNPYQGMPQTMVQPQMQGQMQSQQPAQSFSPAINQSGIIWISGESEASMYPIAPNNAVALWDRNGKAIYLKQADATGKPTMRVYDLVERTESSPENGGSQGDKLSAYATKEDLGTVVSAIKGLSSDIEQMKGDLYGVAGRKRNVKKAEGAEDDT